MATLSTTSTNFSGTTNMGSGANVGTSWSGNTIETVVCRYTFKTDNYGATKISFKTNRGYADVKGNASADDMIGAMRFAVTDSDHPNTYINVDRSRNYGYPITNYKYGGTGTGYVSGSLTYDFLPQKTYYLWVFPNANFASYVRFGIGSCTITTSGSYGQPSTITASNGYFGNSIPITLTNIVGGLTNTVTVACGGITKTLGTKSSSTSFSWTPDLDEYGVALPNSKTATATISTTTYYGSTSWGTRTKQITVTFPNSAAPTIDTDELVLSIDNTGTDAAGFARYVESYSKVTASIAAAALHGASISSYAVMVSGKTESNNTSTVTSATVTDSGTVPVTVSVTDSRGFSSSAVQNITVFPYQDPKILSVSSVDRYDSQGNKDPSGHYFKIQASGSCSDIDGLNSFSMTVAFKKKTDANFGTEYSLQNNTLTMIPPNQTDPNLDPDYTYDIRVTITDTLTKTSTATAVLAGQKWAMKFNTTGTAVGFGKAPEAANNTLEIPEDWVIRRYGPNKDENALFPSDLPSNLSTYLVVDTATGSNQAISANSNGTGTVDCTKTGYTPIAVVGFTTNNANVCVVKVSPPSGNSISYNFKNVGSGAATATAEFAVLYIKS